MGYECTNAYLHLFIALEDTYAEERGHKLDTLFVSAHVFAMIMATMRIVSLGCPRRMYWVYIIRNVEKKLLG